MHVMPRLEHNPHPPYRCDGRAVDAINHSLATTGYGGERRSVLSTSRRPPIQVAALLHGTPHAS